jgi:hypothetical protein
MTVSNLEIREVQISALIRQYDTNKVKQSALAELTRARFLPPLRAEDAQGGAPLILLPSDSGNGHLAISPDNVTLLLRFTGAVAREPERAKLRLKERVRFIFAVLEAMPEITADDILYAGSVVRAVLPCEKQTDSDLARMLSDLTGVKLPPDVEDVNIGYTEKLDDTKNSVVRIKSFKLFDSGILPINQMRMSADQAIERGFEILIDQNTRRAYNLEQDVPVTTDLLNLLLDESVQKAIEFGEQLEGLR